MHIAALRSLNLHMTKPRCTSPVELLKHLGALQAQDYYSSLWAMGLRIPGSTEAEMEKAVSAGDIVLTWPMRGTLHYVPADDAAWMLRLLTPRVVSASATRYRQLGLDGRIFSRCADILGHALGGLKPATRPEIYRLCEEQGIRCDGSRGLHILGHLAQQGVICHGPRRDKQPTFVLFEEWVTTHKQLDGEEALGELARRYFTSHGPATAHDFAWWAGLNLGEARKAAALAGPEIQPSEFGGTTFWGPGNQEASPDSRRAFLLPAFDEFTVAYKDRSAVLDSSKSKKLNAGGGMLSPVMVYGGKVVGTWRRKRTPKAADIELMPFTPLTKSRHSAFAAAANRFGAFVGMPTTISVHH